MIGVLQGFLNRFLGLDLVVFTAFSLLIIAEYLTGIKVARKQGEKFKSSKAGRMIFKIGVYAFMIAILHAFEKSIQTPKLFGVELNPFVWLYDSVLIAIVFQLVVSLFENLGALGYKESKTIAGIVLRRFNKWFEFDGKQGDNSAK
ncbi:MAG: phage holin family protein [Flavobacteriales bacterium]